MVAGESLVAAAIIRCANASTRASSVDRDGIGVLVEDHGDAEGGAGTAVDSVVEGAAADDEQGGRVVVAAGDGGAPRLVPGGWAATISDRAFDMTNFPEGSIVRVVRVFERSCDIDIPTHAINGLRVDAIELEPVLAASWESVPHDTRPHIAEVAPSVLFFNKPRAVPRCATVARLLGTELELIVATGGPEPQRIRAGAAEVLHILAPGDRSAEGGGACTTRGSPQDVHSVAGAHNDGMLDTIVASGRAIEVRAAPEEPRSSSSKKKSKFVVTLGGDINF